MMAAGLIATPTANVSTSLIPWPIASASPGRKEAELRRRPRRPAARLRSASSDSTVTKATTAATTMSDVTPTPACDTRTSVITTDESGSLRTAAQPAGISAATAGVCASPGRCAASTPALAPRNSAGKAGPPRKLPSEMPQASPLNTSRSASVDSDSVDSVLARSPKAFCPENSTAVIGFPVASLKAIASPPTVSAAAIVKSRGRVSTMRFVHRASSTRANVTTAAASARSTVQPTSPQPGLAIAGSAIGLRA